MFQGLNVSSHVGTFFVESVVNFPLKEPQTWSLNAVMLELFVPNVGVTLVDLCRCWTSTSQTLQLSVLSLKVGRLGRKKPWCYLHKFTFFYFSINPLNLRCLNRSQTTCSFIPCKNTRIFKFVDQSDFM